MGECLIIKSGGLDTSDANATSDKVLQGYTCYVNDALVTGTIIRYDKVDNQDTTLAASDVDSRPVILAIAADQIWLLNNKDDVLRLCLAIPKNGYYSNNTFVGIDYSKFAHKLILDNLTTGANATPDSIYQGIVGYVNGQRTVGTMPDRGSTSYTLPINATYWIPIGLHNGNGYVNQNIPVQGGWTITPGVNNIVACWAGHYTTGDIWCAGDANLVPWNIRNGYNIFGVVGNFVGWVDNSTSIRVSSFYNYRANINQDWYLCTSSYVLLNGFCVKGWNYISVTADNTPDYEDVFKTGMLNISYRTSTTGSNGMAFVGRFKEDWYSGSWTSPYRYTDYYTDITARTVQIRLAKSSNEPTAIYALSLGTGSSRNHHGIVGTVTFSL